MTGYYICEGLFHVLKIWLTFALAERIAAQRYSDMVSMVTRMVMAAGLGSIIMFALILDYQPMGAVPTLLCAASVGAAVIWLYRVNWLEGLCAVSLYWGGIHLLDALVQWVTSSALPEGSLDGISLRDMGAERGIYLLVLIVLLPLWSKAVSGIVSAARKWRYSHVVSLISILLLTVAMLFLQRIYGDSVSNGFFLVWIGLFMLCVLIMGAITTYVQNRFRQNRIQMQQMKIRMLESNYQQLSRMYQDKAILLHDEKHHVKAIRELLRSGAHDEALRYVEDLEEQIVESGTRIWSNHQMLDLVLNNKMQEAEQGGIDLDVQIDDVSGLCLKDADLCVLFSNLLDNAIEANQKIPESGRRWIKLRGERKGDLLVLNLSNAIGEPVRMEDGQLSTTKENKDLHGFGMESVKQVLRKYQGEFRVDVNEIRFEMVLYLVGFKEKG